MWPEYDRDFLKLIRSRRQIYRRKHDYRTTKKISLRRIPDKTATMYQLSRGL